MKKEKAGMTKIEDIERAAWYARLAFGIYQETESRQSAEPKKSEPAFYVMP